RDSATPGSTADRSEPIHSLLAVAVPAVGSHHDASSRPALLPASADPRLPEATGEATRVSGAGRPARHRLLPSAYLPPGAEPRLCHRPVAGDPPSNPGKQPAGFQSSPQRGYQAGDGQPRTGQIHPPPAQGRLREGNSLSAS